MQTTGRAQPDDRRAGYEDGTVPELERYVKNLFALLMRLFPDRIVTAMAMNYRRFSACLPESSVSRNLSVGSKERYSSNHTTMLLIFRRLDSMMISCPVGWVDLLRLYSRTNGGQNIYAVLCLAEAISQRPASSPRTATTAISQPGRPALSPLTIMNPSNREIRVKPMCST